MPKILIVEEIGEYLYHIDRMIIQLKRAGVFSKLKALILGDFTDTKETKEVYGMSVEELWLLHCEDSNLSVFTNAPVGHGENNHPIIHGAEVELRSTGNAFQLSYIH